jgi:hypothetical protein
MPETYTVEQGDHLSGIAEKSGFANYETIWNDPNNEALNKKRDNPHVLYPGDQVYIPDSQHKSVSIPTTKVSVFQVMARPLLLRLALQDFDEQPLAGATCVLEVDGEMHNLTTDDKGFLQVRIPRTAKIGILRIPDLDMEVPVKIGNLDPAEEDPGWLGRLINLGYYAGTMSDNDDEQLGYAVEEFQCDHGLKVTGILDETTRAKLKELHGA